MAETMSMLTNLCAMSPNNLGHLQLPLLQAQTTWPAIVKHRRALEDCLLKAGVEYSQTLTLMFNKESARAGADKRPPSQTCMMNLSSKTSKWLEGEIFQTGVLGPLPLVKVSEMEGYDAETRPGAAARVEQRLGKMLELISASIIFYTTPVLFLFSDVDFSSACFHRKGVVLHHEIIEGYLKGITFEESDVVVFVDIVPNRFLGICLIFARLYLKVFFIFARFDLKVVNFTLFTATPHPKILLLITFHQSLFVVLLVIPMQVCRVW